MGPVGTTGGLVVQGRPDTRQASSAERTGFIAGGPAGRQEAMSSSVSP